MAGKFALLVLTIITLVAIFLYGYNLFATVPFDGDTARDTYSMLTIWQEKKFTLLGAPLSLGYGTAKELYFSSLPNYVGLAGLLVSNFNPIGASLPNLILMVASIPLFWLFIKNITQRDYIAHLATMIYAWNPLTVNQARFFWNPNLLIPLATLFWYLVNIGALFWAGVVVGIMFNFHYLGIIGGVVFGLSLLLRRNWVKLAKYCLGATIGASPILVFEIRNRFYLTQTLLWNLSHNDTPALGRSYINPVIGLTKSFLTQLGFISGDLSYPIAYPFSIMTLTGIALILIVVMTLSVRRIWFSSQASRSYLAIFIVSIIILSLAQMTNSTRYMWSVLPISSWLLAESLSSLKSKLLILTMLGFMLGNSLINVLHDNSDSVQTYSLAKLQAISDTIIADNPPKRYNISESILGDARFVSLRYFLSRDSSVKPLDITEYANLDRLYVIASDASHAMEGGRWEFIATPNLVPTAVLPVKDTVVVRYERSQ